MNFYCVSHGNLGNDCFTTIGSFKDILGPGAPVYSKRTSNRANLASLLLADRSRQDLNFVNAAQVRYTDSTRFVVSTDVGCCSCPLYP